MLQWFATLAVRYSRAIVAAWLVFLVVCGSFAVKLPAVLQDHGLRVEGDYARTQQILAADFHIPDEPVILLFENKIPLSPQGFHLEIAGMLRWVEQVSGIREVISPWAREGMLQEKAAYALLVLDTPPRETQKVLDDIRSLFPDNDRLAVSMTGKPVVQEDVNRTSHADLTQAEIIGVPLAFIILWIAFGGFISAMIPVVVGLIGVIGTMGIMYGLGTRLELSIFVLNVIPMVGLALSIDFALMLVSRFREELRRHPLPKALGIAMSTAGRAVFFSALCVYLGLAGTLFIRMPIFNSVAIGAMIVLTVSLLLTFTLVPALLVLAGGRLQAEGRGRRIVRSSLWAALSAYVMRRPVLMGTLASVALLVCLLPLTRMEMTVPDATSLPRHYESRQTAERFAAYFSPPTVSQVYMVAEAGQIHPDRNDWLAVYDLAERLRRSPGVLRVESVFDRLSLSPGQLHMITQNADLKKRYGPLFEPFVQGNRMLIAVTLKGGPSSKTAIDWARKWGAEEELSSRLSIQVGGEPKYQQEVYDEIRTKLKYVFLFVFGSNFLVLFLAFRSLWIPLKTILMNLLSLGASFGILVWIFQDGRFGLEPTSIAIMIPVFVFGLTFGISMDYGVFLLSRIYEIYLQTKDNERSVLEGLTITSKIISSAAAIMIAVTAPFAWGGVAGVKQLGIGIAAAILIDATIVRMMLVPSLMKLLGRWNWWAP